MWTSNVLSSFSRGILQCDDLKEMALHYGLKDPTIHHIYEKQHPELRIKTKYRVTRKMG